MIITITVLLVEIKNDYNNNRSCLLVQTIFLHILFEGI